ncbi:MAG TPA: hypothetical protein VF960_10510 [Chloroflexota bacterium]
MTPFAKFIFMGLVLAAGLIAGGCASEAPSTASTTAPASPVPQITPTATGTPSPADIEGILSRVAQYDQQLRQLSADSPSPDDLVNTLQETLTLADYVTAYYPQMASQQRAQALSALAGVLGDAAAVVNTHTRVFAATATAFAVAYPTATPGPGTPTAVPLGPRPALSASTAGPAATVGPGTLTPNPVSGQLTADLDAAFSDTISMASGLPSDQDIANVLQRVQGDITQLSRQSTSMSNSEAQSVLKAVDQVLANLVPVVQAHTARETSSVSTPTPLPTATPPTASSPAPAASATPGP